MSDAGAAPAFRSYMVVMEPTQVKERFSSRKVRQSQYRQEAKPTSACVMLSPKVSMQPWLISTDAIFNSRRAGREELVSHSVCFAWGVPPPKGQREESASPNVTASHPTRWTVRYDSRRTLGLCHPTLLSTGTEAAAQFIARTTPSTCRAIAHTQH